MRAGLTYPPNGDTSSTQGAGQGCLLQWWTAIGRADLPQVRVELFGADKLWDAAYLDGLIRCLRLLPKPAPTVVSCRSPWKSG